MLTDITPDGTAASEIRPAPSISQTRAEAALLNEETGFLRNRARLLNRDVDQLHGETSEQNLVARSVAFNTESVPDLLARLADAGFSWRDMARMLRISVPALRKWRLGDTPSPQNRQRLARVVATVDILETDCAIADVASWMEIPFFYGVSITPIDLVAASEELVAIHLAGAHISPEDALDRVLPEWRSAAPSSFEVVEGADGNLSIQLKTTD